MTIASETNKSGPYNGNGVTTVFAYGFRILDETHIQVIKTVTATGVETVQTLTTHYTVASVGSATGSITMLTAPATGTTITIVRDVPFTQELDLENQGAYLAETVEEAFDKLTQQTQQLKEGLDRAVQVTASSSTDPATLIASLEASEDAAVSAAAASAASAAAALVSENAAAASALSVDLLPVQIAAATDEAFADTAHLTARKADGTLLKRSWLNIKAALFTYIVGKRTYRPNLFWNGNHVISQQNTGTLGTTTGYFAADNMAMYFTAATAAMSVQQVATVSLNGSKYQVEYKCTTAKASLGASDYVALTGKIEGFDCQALKWGSASAVPATLSFNYTGPAGLRHVHIQNAAGNRHIAIPFTPAAADTEERITVAVPADTGGTWTYDNTGMVTIDFIEAAGATVTGGTASTWGATTYYAAATQKNILDSIANVVRITDIQFSADPDSTGVAPAYEMPGYAETLRKCQRYYLNGVTLSVDFNASAGSAYSYQQLAYPTTMRATPTLTTGAAAGGSSNTSAQGFADISAVSASFRITSSAGGRSYYLSVPITASSRM